MDNEEFLASLEAKLGSVWSVEEQDRLWQLKPSWVYRSAASDGPHGQQQVITYVRDHLISRVIARLDE